MYLLLMELKIISLSLLVFGNEKKQNTKGKLQSSGIQIDDKRREENLDCEGGGYHYTKNIWSPSYGLKIHCLMLILV